MEEASTSTKLTKCWGKYSRQNTSRRKKLDTENDLIAYERSLINDRDFSYIIGSDETGRGSIAGPVVSASCCILTLEEQCRSSARSTSIPNLCDLLPTASLITNNSGNLIKDSKQLSPEDRERIYNVIVENPHVYKFTTAQRSNIEIDSTNNILTSTMECFQESIDKLAQEQLFPHIFSRQKERNQNQEEEENQLDNKGDDNDDDNTSITTSTTSTIIVPEDWDDCGCYSIVDGKKAPKLSSHFPNRPLVKADALVYTVALASIIAKVTLDRMIDEWHDAYPEYDFQQNKGYATRDHIEAIHRYGACPLHRMTFKSLKGR